MKPDAPADIRGQFQPIATTVPGVQVCEYLPLLSKQMGHLTLIRSVHHTVLDHNAGQLYALTGRPPLRGTQLIQDDLPTNSPNLGSILARLRPSQRGLPSFVQMPDYRSNDGRYAAPGQRAGFLGSAYDPFIAGDPSREEYHVSGMTLLPEVALDRIRNRRGLLGRMQTSRGHWTGHGLGRHIAPAARRRTDDAVFHAVDVRGICGRARVGLCPP